MRRTAMALALVMGLAAAAQAQWGPIRERLNKTTLSLWGGYSTVDMGDVNDFLSAAGGGSTTEIDSGYYGAFEFLVPVHEHISIGPRVEYLMTNEGKASGLIAESKIEQSLLPVMIGGRYVLKNMDDEGTGFYEKSEFNAGLFAGYGWANAKTKISAAGFDTSYKSDGGDFVGDVMLGWAYHLTGSLTFGVDVGYRYAPISEMKASEDNALLGVTDGMVIKDQNGKTVKNDFSGLIAEVGLRFRM